LNATAARPLPPAADRVARLRSLALRGLPRMYDPAAERFVFRVRRTAGGIRCEGLSHRYTAIALIGLAGESAPTAGLALRGARPSAVCASLVSALGANHDLGDVALTAWACAALGHPGRERALRRLHELRPLEGPQPAVALAWTLAALCLAGAGADEGLRAAVARRLLASRVPASGLFPHVAGGARGLRGHVCCFADIVYPVHALSLYARATGDREALAAALRCARVAVATQGADGQWWWHYDVRTGRVVERYPVYAVHQDSMAPLALLALADASGEDFAAPIERGLQWLESAPELAGGSLIDDDAELVWRKVARRGPGKLARALQAGASRAHPAWRVPGLDRLLPARAIDDEDRPYHLGWVLHAWRGREGRRPAGGGLS
jgi:hypothetical protein